MHNVKVFLLSVALSSLIVSITASDADDSPSNKRLVREPSANPLSRGADPVKGFTSLPSKRKFSVCSGISDSSSESDPKEPDHMPSPPPPPYAPPYGRDRSSDRQPPAAAVAPSPCAPSWDRVLPRYYSGWTPSDWFPSGWKPTSVLQQPQTQEAPKQYTEEDFTQLLMLSYFYGR